MAYYPSSLAEGTVGSGGDGSILEEYLDHLLVMPVEVKRYITLTRELDVACEKEYKAVEELQSKFLKTLKGKFEDNDSWSIKEKEAFLTKLRNSNQFKTLVPLRKRMYQKIDEKISISEQLFDMSERNLKVLTKNKDELENILRSTGEIRGRKIEKTPVPKSSTKYVGRLAAALSKSHAADTGEELWILSKVKEWHNNGKVVVSDVDNPQQRQTLRASQVVLLEGKFNVFTGYFVTLSSELEDIATARARLPNKGMIIILARD